MHIRPQLAAYVQEFLAPDIYNRDGSKCSSVKDKTNAIKDLYRDMGIEDERRYGSWQDVPIMRHVTKFVKREFRGGGLLDLRRHTAAYFFPVPED